MVLLTTVQLFIELLPKNMQNLDQKSNIDKTLYVKSNKFTPVQRILYQRCW